MRSAIRLTRGEETHVFIAKTAAEIAEYLDYESVYDLGRDPCFDGLFEELAIVDVDTMICVGTKWNRVV